MRLLLAALSLVLVLLSAGLRPDAFYAGDPGIKLIAARSALAHPSHPFDIALPTIAGEATPHVEPFFSVHDQHAHAVTSPLFPVLTAPLLGVIGPRGIYLLPAIAFLALVAAVGAIAQRLDHRRNPLLASSLAAVATPFLFYGLEFWEHAPALACGAWATALFLRARSSAAGLLFGLATLLRPEAVFFTGAVLGGSLWWFPRRPMRECWWVAAGMLIVIAPYEIYTLRHFGTLLPPYLTANVGAAESNWLAVRLELAQLWFISASDASIWRVAPVVAVAAASLVFRGDRAGRGFLWLVAFATAVMVLLTAPNDGGGQWGPRYLLFTYIPLIVLAADLIETLPARKPILLGVLATTLLASLWIQRGAYRQLRGTKATYGRVVDFVRSHAAADEHLVTDIWWLDQVAAAQMRGQQLLFAADENNGRAIVQRLSDRTVPTILILRSAAESPDVGSWSDGTCYFEEERARTSTRALVAIRLRHRCGH